jgi:hypothetical protein
MNNNINKAIFNLIRDNYDELDSNLVHSVNIFLKDTKTLGALNTKENEYLVYGKEFLLKVSYDIVLDNENLDNGSWYKEYTVEELTSTFWNKEQFGLDNIIKVLKKYFRSNQIFTKTIN